jgi:hypothetical protein
MASLGIKPANGAEQTGLAHVQEARTLGSHDDREGALAPQDAGDGGHMTQSRTRVRRRRAA